MPCWVGSYIEAGASTSGSKTPYLAFPFCGPSTKAEATARAGAKLLAGPFNTSGDAQAWADSYNKNPKNPKAGNDLSPSNSISTNDNPPAPVSAVLQAGAVADSFFRQLTKASMWRSLGWITLGGTALGLGIWWYAKTEASQGIKSVASGKMPHLTAPVLPLSLMGAGTYLLWFGVTYWEDTKTIWPSDPVKAVLQGKGLPARAADISASDLLSASETTASQASSNPGSGTAEVPSGATGSPQTQARGLLSKFGWDASQFLPLVSLWNQESSWNPKARNPTSGAFGVAQALGHGVPGGAAADGINEYGGFGLSVSQAKAANSGNAYWQIMWGLHYIAATYGSPSAAWLHEQKFNWY